MAIWTAVIWFSVSVPVLSELMADVEPSAPRSAQALHDRSGGGERRGPGSEDRGDDGRQTGRDGRHGESDGRQEEDLERLVPGEAEGDRDRQRDAGDDEDLVGQLVELLRERRRFGRLRLEHVGDVADLGRHARRRHDEGRGAAGDLRVHERHVDAVAERRVGGTGSIAFGTGALSPVRPTRRSRASRRAGCGRRRGPGRRPRR